MDLTCIYMNTTQRCGQGEVTLFYFILQIYLYFIFIYFLFSFSRSEIQHNDLHFVLVYSPWYD